MQPGYSEAVIVGETAMWLEVCYHKSAAWPASKETLKQSSNGQVVRKHMVTTLSAGEEGQLAQTIEMFEVITQSQPLDYQSLEILKEAYSKLGREKDVVWTSKRIAQAYVQMGQLSSAILEYETILQRFPDDPDVQAALKQIEGQANSFPVEAAASETLVVPKSAP